LDDNIRIVSDQINQKMTGIPLGDLSFRECAEEFSTTTAGGDALQAKSKLQEVCKAQMLVGQRRVGLKHGSKVTLTRL
jgi:hypothetical protein